MARELLNTLFVTTQGAYVHLDHETLRVEVEGETRLRVPVHHLGSVVCFGRVSVSTAAMSKCAEGQRDLVFLSRSGRFRAKVIGPTSGNVLLRLAQYQACQDQNRAVPIARNIVAAKIQNARLLLMREARQTEEQEAEDCLRAAAGEMASAIEALPKAGEMDRIRGNEGRAAAVYFSVFNRLVRSPHATFTFDGRNRRPPRDPVNALLSFLYSMVRVECQAACEGVGLDPQMGFLHSVRPGRPSLALDLLEELRAPVADRLALTLINRRQLTPNHFLETPGGGVSLSDEGRKTVLAAYQKRKADEVHHPAVRSKTPIGLLPHLQARLLARHLRGTWNTTPRSCTGSPMWVLVTYDVSTETAKGRTRLRRVAKTCEGYGQRVQKSVFECTVSDVTFHQMKTRLLEIINEKEDSIRFYKLPGNRDRRVEEYGQGNVVDFTGPLVV